MQKRSALVVGGTGPTGPAIVEGLSRRGYGVTIFHSGRHEVDFSVPDVEHIHDDPHFEETIERGLGTRTFDVAILLYGRLRLLAQHLKGRAGHAIAIGSAINIYAGPDDARWGGLGRPAQIPDTTTVFRRDDGKPGVDKLRLRMVQAMETFFACHPRGTYVGYPNNYGPRQPAPHDWLTIRRILDGRRRVVIGDGGLKTDSHVFTENAAQAVLAVVDKPEIAAGKRYTIADRTAYSIRQRIEFVARHMGAEIELINMPYEIAWPCWPSYRYNRYHSLTESNLFRQDLGFVDPFTVEEGLAKTVDWLLANRPDPDTESKLGDPFDYAAEDALVVGWRECGERLGAFHKDILSPGHPYLHPKKPGEVWTAVPRRRT